MIFTIDAENNITAFATAEEAAAVSTTAVETFASQKELAALAEAWPAERVVTIWNSLPGVKEVKGFKSAKAGARRIWERIQKLGDGSKPEEQAKAKKFEEGQQGRQGRQNRARESQVGKESQIGKERAQSEARRQDGRERSARGQHDRSGRCHAPAEERSDDFRDYGCHGLAKAHGSRVHGRRDEEGGLHGRVLQTGRGERSYRINK